MHGLSNSAGGPTFALLQKLADVRETSPGQWIARCPAHDDSTSSLSVSTGADGKAILYCHAGCDRVKVLRACNAQMSDLFPIPLGDASTRHPSRRSGQTGNSEGGHAGRRPLGPIVATYSYRAADGSILYQVTRHIPKDFRQRRRSDDGRRWIWKTVDAKDRVLYRLPEILAAPIESPIFLVEGEKDADRLAASGLVATTSAGGAASSKTKHKWLPQYTETLRGRTVFIVPDSDKPGQQHATTVAKALHGVARFVSILDLPLIAGLDPSKKWDVSDWLDAQGTREQFFEAVELARGKPFDPQGRSASEEGHPDDIDICNAENIAGMMAPVPMREIVRRIRAATGDWPRRVGSALFVDRITASEDSAKGTIPSPDTEELGEGVPNAGAPDDVASDFETHTPDSIEPHETESHSRAIHNFHWLERPSQLFAFIGAHTGTPPSFHKIPGTHTKEEVFAGLQQSATAYSAVEVLPHEPPIPGHYYACDIPAPGPGDALLGLVQRFSPATPLDCDLILSLFATLLWGGPGGSRPAFVITSDDGRGVGKSKMAGMVAQLAGGVIEISANEDAAKMKERLLSPEGLSRRVALLDNVKTLRFSWAELEALITSPTVSGKRLYVGEASRPNNLTWIITLNGVSLSTDMAQRAIVIKIRRPTHSGDWEEETRQYIDQHRQAIIADLIGYLRGRRSPLLRYTRWGAWERSVLALSEDPDALQNEILARQESSDVEEEDAALIVEFFRERLNELGYTLEHDQVFIPSSVAADWLCRATNERHTVTGATRMLKQKCQEGAIREIVASKSKSYGRGFLWIPERPVGEIKLTLRARIEGVNLNTFEI